MLLNLTFNFRIWSTFRTKSFKERRQEELRKQRMAEEAEVAGVPDAETATELGEASPPVVIKEERVTELGTGDIAQEQDWQLTDETPVIVSSQELSPIITNSPETTVPVVSPDSLLVCTVSAMGLNEGVRISDYKTLKRQTYLNDVALFSNMLMKWDHAVQKYGVTGVHMFSYVFGNSISRDLTADQLAHPPTDELASQLHDRVSRYTHSPTKDIDIFSHSLVIWPILRDEHWFLIVATNLNRKRAQLFALNSLGNFGQGAILDHLLSYLKIEFSVAHPGETCPAIRFVRTNPPQQRDGTSCGLFAILFVEELLKR